MNQFGEGTRPLYSVPIKALQHAETQERWIIVTAEKQRCWIDVFHAKDGSTERTHGTNDPIEYPQFWEAVKNLPLDHRKYWIIGFNMRYVIEKAGMLQMLEAGAIKLPRGEKSGAKKKQGGRLTISSQTLEIDMVVGKHDVKLLDWRNYGIEPEDLWDASSEATREAQCEVLQIFLTKCQTWGIVANRSTAAQLGWAHYRRHHMPPVLTADLDIEQRQFERRGYFAGRNEPYFIGHVPERVYSLDVKGCYAHICATERMPVAACMQYRGGISMTAIDEDRHLMWMADCIIATSEPAYPVHYAGQPIYPTGQFRTTLPDPEFRHALKMGRVLQILSATSYYADYAMATWANWYTHEKAQPTAKDRGQLPGALKRVFNSTLGYTARRKYQMVPWETHQGRKWWIGTTSSPEDHTTPVQCQILDGVAQWLKIGGEPREAIPFLHATITSYARIKLWDIINKAERENVYYVDTDGLLLNMQGVCQLTGAGMIEPNTEGKLQERLQAGKCVINGPKSYRIGKQVICAGLAMAAHSTWTPSLKYENQTGRKNEDGTITPYVMRTEEIDGQVVNVMVDHP